jgi:hypothetical protein
VAQQIRIFAAPIDVLEAKIEKSRRAARRDVGEAVGLLPSNQCRSGAHRDKIIDID